MKVAIVSQILDLISETIILLDPSDKVVLCNSLDLVFDKISEDDVVGCSFTSLEAKISKQLRNPESFIMITRQIAKKPGDEWSGELDLLDGEAVSVTTRPVVAPDKRVSRLWCFRKRIAVKSSEKDDQSKEHKYREFFDSAPFGVIHYGASGKLLDANPAAAKILGYESLVQMVEMMKNTSVREFIFAKKQMVLQLEKKASEDSVTWVMDEGKIFCQGGSVATCELFLRAMREDGASYQIILRDISDEKKAETLAQESHDRLKASLRLMRDLINTHSEDFQNPSEIEPPRSLPNASRLLEMNYIEGALRKTKGKVQPAAHLLGISRYALIRQIAKMGIDPKKFR